MSIRRFYVVDNGKPIDYPHREARPSPDRAKLRKLRRIRKGLPAY